MRSVLGNVSGRWVMLADIETEDSQRKIFKLWKLLTVRIPACRNAISHERMHPIYTEVLFAAENFDVLQSRNVIHIYCSSSSMLLLTYGYLVAHMYTNRRKLAVSIQHDLQCRIGVGHCSKQKVRQQGTDTVATRPNGELVSFTQREMILWDIQMCLNSLSKWGSRAAA